MHVYIDTYAHILTYTHASTCIQAMGVPIPAAQCAAIVHRGLNWKDIDWGITGVTVLGTAYTFKCCFWLPVMQQAAGADS